MKDKPQRTDRRGLAEVTRDTAVRKHRAAQARTQGRLAGAEEPGAVYLAACERIGAALTPEGFRYAKSGPRLTRTRGEWTERVSFQSSHSNVAGEQVALWVHAYLENKTLKDWRRRTPSVFRRDGWVAGGQIGNLHPHHRWIDWDLADAGSREATLSDVLREIRETAFGYFALVEDVPRLYRELLEQDVPSIDVDSAVELLLCYLGRDEACSYLAAWRARRADLEVEVKTALAAASAIVSTLDAGPHANATYAQQYAVAVTRYGL